jgi:hypothetical protein
MYWWTSAPRAPGVSVSGMILSAIWVTVPASESSKNRGFQPPSWRGTRG